MTNVERSDQASGSGVTSPAWTSSPDSDRVHLSATDYIRRREMAYYRNSWLTVLVFLVVAPNMLACYFAYLTLIRERVSRRTLELQLTPITSEELFSAKFVPLFKRLLYTKITLIAIWFVVLHGLWIGCVPVSPGIYFWLVPSLMGAVEAAALMPLLVYAVVLKMPRSTPIWVSAVLAFLVLLITRLVLGFILPLVLPLHLLGMTASSAFGHMGIASTTLAGALILCCCIPLMRLVRPRFKGLFAEAD